MSNALRTLGSDGFKAPGISLGCMSMSFAYSSGGFNDEESKKVLRAAVEAGCMLDTSDVYGPHTNEVLIGEVLKTVPREKVILATKFGVSFTEGGEPNVRGDAAYVRECIEGSLKRLGTDYIDLYYVHRKDPTVPIEETMGALKELVEEGKVKHVGVSEFGPENIRRAHAVHPISAAQIEWSLWSRDVEEEIVPVLRELNIGIVAYSPLGRGFLTGAIVSPDQIEAGDVRAHVARFQKEAFEANLRLLDAIKAQAEKKGITPGQLALAWVLKQGDDVVAIPGTRHVRYFEENLAAAGVGLTEEEFAELTLLSDSIPVVGIRTSEAMLKMGYQGDGNK